MIYSKTLTIDHGIYTLHVSFDTAAHEIPGLTIELSEDTRERRFFFLESTIKSIYRQVCNSKLSKINKDREHLQDWQRIAESVFNLDLGGILKEFQKICSTAQLDIDISDVELNPVNYMTIKSSVENDYIHVVEFYANKLVN